MHLKRMNFAFKMMNFAFKMMNSIVLRGLGKGVSETSDAGEFRFIIVIVIITIIITGDSSIEK